VQVHEVSDVAFLPHNPPVRGVDKLASEPHTIIQVITEENHQELF
jgi:hypothetical protein